MKRPYLVPQSPSESGSAAHESAISPIEDIIADARNGRPYILVDAEDRENEGDVIIPAQFATPDQINFMAKHARGLICLSITAERARVVDAELWSRPHRDRTPTQLRDLVRRIITRLAPDMIRRRPEQAEKKRGLRYWSDDHGATGVLQLRLPADEARGVYSVVDAIARRAGDAPDGAPRDMEQKRGDTARDLAAPTELPMDQLRAAHELGIDKREAPYPPQYQRGSWH